MRKISLKKIYKKNIFFLNKKNTIKSKFCYNLFKTKILKSELRGLSLKIPKSFEFPSHILQI